MAQNNVKFYRLGYNTPVTLATYEQYAVDPNIVFAKVAEGAGDWDASTSTLSAPTYRIFAGGIHYNVADADALNYVMDQVNTWKGDVTVEGSILNIISKAVSAAQIVALVDTTSSNVSADVVEVEGQNKIKLTAANSTVVTTGSATPDKAVVNPKNGDYYIQEVTINGSDVPSRTAYIYNGATSAWQALDGNVTAENVYFPEGLQRTAQFGFQEASMDIQTECEGMNLKDLLEWYLVEEKYPSASLTQATAEAGSYSISLNTPGNITTYVTGPANSSLVEVGTQVKFNGITLTETASHNGEASYTGTPGSITGMKYNYNANAVGGALVKDTSYTSNTPTTNASYTTNFTDATAQMKLTASGFNNITTADASCGVQGGTLSLSAQTGTTAEGENKLTLSWSNDATVSRALTDSEGISAYTAYPLSNKGNASTNIYHTVTAKSWSQTTANATPKTYTATTYTVHAVYPIYTNGVTVSSTFVASECKWSTKSFNISDTAGGETRAVAGEKLVLYNYKTNKKTSYYIGTGNQNPISDGEPFIIYIPASANITKISASSYNVGKGDWSGETCKLTISSNVYINGVLYNMWSGQGTFGAQNILVKFE